MKSQVTEEVAALQKQALAAGAWRPQSGWSGGEAVQRD